MNVPAAGTQCPIDAKDVPAKDKGKGKVASDNYWAVSEEEDD